MPFSNIDKPSKYFNTVLYTGTGSTQSITGVGFQPDWVWIKNRTSGYNHYLYDVIRTPLNVLQTNATDANVTQTNGLSAFNSDGFTLLDNRLNVNASGENHVSWNWKANGAGVSNTAGSITSTVSANTTSGFSIVSYTGTGANATVGHGLGVAPKMVIVKGRNSAPDYWFVYHSGLTDATYSQYLSLAIAEQSGQADKWNSTAPSTNVFSIGTNSGVNQSTYNFIAYCFAEVKGFSKIGKYTGNGSTDGTFVYTGFKPAFVLHKVTSTTEPWIISDNKRDTYNVIFKSLRPNSSAAETTNENVMDFVSNGFKLRTTNTRDNGSGSTYIYMAFAENPFVSSKGIPTTAR